MKHPVPDKAEVAIDYPDKFYMGTFERGSSFEAHADAAGISLTLERTGANKRTVRLHLHYDLFAEMLGEIADTIAALPAEDVHHRETLGAAADKLARSLRAP